MRRVLVSVLVMAFVVAGKCPAEDGPVAKARAESVKPLAVISFAGYAALLRDVEYLGKLANQPQATMGLEFAISMATGGRGVQGLDKERPWGVVLQLDEKKLSEGEMQPDRLLSAVAFVPVSEFDKVLETVKNLGADVKEQAGGVLEITTPQMPVYVKHQGKWAFVSVGKEMPASLPQDPVAQLAGMNGQYDLAVRLNVANLPQAFLGGLLQGMEAQVQAGLSQNPNESPEEFEIRKSMAQAGIAAIKKALAELEQITLGLKIDPAKGTMYVDLASTAKPGTGLAEALAGLGKATTEHAGFVQDDATFQLQWCVKGSPRTGIDRILGFLRKRAMEEIAKSGQAEQEKKISQELAEGLLDLAKELAQSGKADLAACMTAKADSLVVLAAGYVADGAKAEGLFRKLLDRVKLKHPEVVRDWVKLDADKQGDVRFHTVTFPIPANAPNRERSVKFFGETPTIVVGFGPTTMYLAVGRQPLPELKQAVARSREVGARSAPPFQAVTRMKDAAKLMASAEKGPAKEKMEKWAGVLQTVNGKDHFRLAAEAVEGGVRVRLEMEEGLLKAAAAAQQ